MKRFGGGLPISEIADWREPNSAHPRKSRTSVERQLDSQHLPVAARSDDSDSIGTVILGEGDPLLFRTGREPCPKRVVATSNHVGLSHWCQDEREKTACQEHHNPRRAQNTPRVAN